MSPSAPKTSGFISAFLAVSKVVPLPGKAQPTSDLYRINNATPASSGDADDYVSVAFGYQERPLAFASLSNLKEHTARSLAGDKI